jgi:hypothetical protein
MNINHLIGRLKKAQQELALQAMLKPSGKDLFTLGQASGMVIGLEAAINLIEELLQEDRDGKFDI